MDSNKKIKGLEEDIYYLKQTLLINVYKDPFKDILDSYKRLLIRLEKDLYTLKNI